MMNSVIGTMVSLFWAIVFLFFLLYVFGLTFLQGITSCLEDMSKDTAEPDVVFEADVYKHFGSMKTTMLSLYKATTGGNDWDLYYSIIVRAGSLYETLFILYLAFFTFAVMNILTGMVVEHVEGIADLDEQSILLEHRRKHTKAADQVTHLFRTLNKDSSGFISVVQAQEVLQHHEVVALMASMDLDVKDANMFCEMLISNSAGGKMKFDSFIQGVVRLKGYASSIDLQCALYQIRLLGESVHRIRSFLCDHENGSNVRALDRCAG